MDQLQKQINEISLQSKGKCPPFVPHITIVGAFPCENDQESKILLQELRTKFQGFGSIPCYFVPYPPNENSNKVKEDKHGQGYVLGEGRVVCSISKEGSILWNQSCLSIMHRSKKFMNAVRMAKEVIFSATEEICDIEFSPPVMEPHFSFAYGNFDANLCSSIPSPPDLISTTMSLFWTYPVSLEGVQEWSEVGRIDLR